MSNEGKREAEVRHALVRAGEYKKAIRSLDRCIEKHPRDSLLYRERGHLHLYLGRTQLARSDFDATERLEAAIFHTRAGSLHSDNEYCAIGITYWMEGHRELALAFWRYTTNLLCENHVSYAGQGGGIETGLLLWFGATYARSPADVELVRKLYQQRLASKHWSHNLSDWPGPLVQFFLENIDEAELLKSAATPTDVCEAHFALAIRARSQGRYAASKKYLKCACETTEPFDLYDYYNTWAFILARFEVEKN